MTTAPFEFTVGDIQCRVFLDGYVKMGPLPIFFTTASSDEIDALAQEYDLKPDGILLPVTVLMLEIGEHRILIDCGGGESSQRNGLGRLVANMKAAGIATGSITHVILTHGHYDHVGGVVDNENRPTFGSARYIMTHGCWNYWVEDIKKHGIPEPASVLRVIRPLLDLVEPDSEALPGIELIATPGHTENHSSVKITSGGETLICSMDTLVHPAHIAHPEFTLRWDVSHEQSTASRHKVLDLATQPNTRLYACHFAPPGLGHVTKQDDRWSWQPIDTINLI